MRGEAARKYQANRRKDPAYREKMRLYNREYHKKNRERMNE